MSSKQDHVFIGFPSFGPVPIETVESLANLFFFCKKTLVFATLNQVDIVVARNKMVDAILDNEDYTHLLFIDSDMTFPNDLVDILVEKDKDVIGAVAVKRHSPYSPNMSVVKDDGFREILEYPMNDTFRVDTIGSAVTMVKRSVFEKLGRNPYDFLEYKGQLVGEDWSFCLRCKDAGIEVWATTELDIGHMGAEMVTMEHHFKYMDAVEGGLIT